MQYFDHCTKEEMLRQIHSLMLESAPGKSAKGTEHFLSLIPYTSGIHALISVICHITFQWAYEVNP